MAEDITVADCIGVIDFTLKTMQEVIRWQTNRAQEALDVYDDPARYLEHMAKAEVVAGLLDVVKRETDIVLHRKD